MNEKKTSKWRIAALYAASAGMSYATGVLFPLSRGSLRSNPVVFTVEFFAPILVLLVLACCFVIFTPLRHDLVAVATGVACHLGAVPGPNTFLPMTLVMFVGAAFIGAAVGRDIRKVIRRGGQHPAAPCSERCAAARSPPTFRLAVRRLRLLPSIRKLVSAPLAEIRRGCGMQTKSVKLKDVPKTTGIACHALRRLLAQPVAGVLPAAAVLVGGEDAMATDTNAFVRVSERDHRYFELSDGRPYIPIGFNLVDAPKEEEWDAVIGKMAESKINYCRLWIGHNSLDVEHVRSGEYDADRAARLKRFLDLAGAKGIKVKLCLEFFRDIPIEKAGFFDRPLHHVANGGPFTGMKDFLDSDKGRAQFKRKLAWCAQQVGAAHPAVFAWELWNEMNCVNGSCLPWTQAMLPELHRLFPRNLAVQSFGSFDRDESRAPYRQLCELEGNDVAQVHQYLDLGAGLKICHGPIDLLAADAVRELLAFNVHKPVILTETGAVKPNHTGASELYAKDKEGVLLHDMLFAPFFSGAAGPGHVWFWREAIAKPDLWHHFARFAEVVADIDPPAEQFAPVMIQHERLRVYVLKGRGTVLLWCRDSRNDWRSELEQGIGPETIHGLKLDLRAVMDGAFAFKLRCYDPWTDHWLDAPLAGGTVALPVFRRSIVLRLERSRLATER